MSIDFEVEVIERLTRVETTLDNGITRRLGIVEDYIKAHPPVCPLRNRKREMLYIAGIMCGVLALVELGKHLVGIA